MTTAPVDNGRWARALVRGLCGDGAVCDVVVSPGSRSTPLVVAFAAERVRAHVVLDERAAAFFALGLARTSGRPVALVCTSGSAPAHYLPAVIEAAASCVPLILLTADRPADLQGVGAAQTVDQVHLFGRHVRRAFHLDAPGAGDEGWLATVAALALDAASSSPLGPVHINCPYRKPLLGREGVGHARGPVRVVRGVASLDDAQHAALVATLRGASRGAIVAGPAWPPLERDAVGALAAALGWPILAEPASQLRGPQDPSGGKQQVTWVGTSDCLVREPALARALRPDLVVRLGRLPTSTAVHEWLRGVDAVLVDVDGSWHDPTHSAHTLVATEPNALCRALAERISQAGTGAGPKDGGRRPWSVMWQTADAAARAVLDGVCNADGPMWEGAIAREVARALPAGSVLHVASSMPIRDLDSFAGSLRDGVRVLHSRGANGIDGTIATAAGEAAGAGPVVVLMGDLAFRHDASSLAVARSAGVDLTLVVVDNGGGGIFEFLPIAGSDAFERFFLTPQEDSVAAIAAGYGARVTSVTHLAGLRESLRSQPSGVRVLHVAVDRAHNVATHRRAWAEAARAALAASSGGFL